METDNLIDVSQITYRSGKIINPFNLNLKTKVYNKIIFADDTASGRPCKIVENLIADNIYPYYSNTHSNASCGIHMKNLLAKTKDIIRHTMNLSDNHAIIFSGNGCTGAVNHLVSKIDFNKHKKICIHTSSYEHHSNFLPWKEKLINDHRDQGVMISQNFIDTNDNFEILTDNYLKKLESEINDDNIQKNMRLDIFTLTACSNVTGKRYDLGYDSLWKYIQGKKITGIFYVFAFGLCMFGSIC